MFPSSRIRKSFNHFIVPEDNSTSPLPLIPETPGVRSRTLPRSPLFRFQNISSSLEYWSGSLATSPPSQYLVSVEDAARECSERTPRRPNRTTFRHQTNSFSFDDSVRASAAYEQDRISSTSTTNSLPRPTEHVSLHEELRESSFASVRSFSADFSTGAPEAYQDTKESESISGHIVPSAQLPLPPPFSTVSRRASTAGSLPSLPDQNSSNPSATLAREISISPLNKHIEHINTSSIVNHADVDLVEEVALSPMASSTSHKIYQCADYL